MERGTGRRAVEGVGNEGQVQKLTLGVRNVLNTWRPAAYHGWGKRPPFFEGWYLKVVDPAGQHPYAVIPGVFVGHDPESTHAFIQTLDGATGRSTYHRYPCAAFEAAPRDFDIRIGPNRFRRDRMVLDIDSPERRLQGEVAFAGGAGWPVTLASPGIMGWYAYMPFMECYHGVLSFDHELSGRLAVDGESLDYTGGRGYIEKDWGQSFPKAWIWTQSNGFPTAGTCVTASVAVIPWVGSAFNGFIAGLWHRGRLYRFATYTGARLERQEVSDQRVVLHYADSRRDGYRLEVEATRASGGLLRSPERTAMLQRVMESLTATVHVRLLDNATGRVIFDEVGQHAGLEVVGDLPELKVKR
jgi:tocopherol cyclase